MPPRDQELPEGTDQIINGAMETGAGTGASTGSSGLGGGFGGTGSGGTTPGGSADLAGTSGTGAAGGSGSGFIGAGGGSGDGTGGLASGTGAGIGLAGGTTTGGSGGGTTTGGSGGGLGGGSDLGGGGSGGGSFGGGSGGEFGGGSSGGTGGSGTGGAIDQARGGAQSLKQQASEKVRTYAEDGKTRATSALDDLAQLVNETAQSIDDRLGPQYGDYARRAAGTVTDLSENLRNKPVDELFDDARDLVRKSPAVAIGAAAAVGFALVRLIKAGIPEERTEIEFQPDPQLSSGSTGTSTGSTGTSTAGSTSVGSQAPYVAPTTGV